MRISPDMNTNDVEVFQEHRAFLLGLAYRILGSKSDAEDILQDIFIKWHQQPKSDIIQPKAWLTTLCTRQSIDLLRSAHKARTEYIGTWLPEPYHAVDQFCVESNLTLSTAFLLLLEKLSPKERAAYLLHDIFDYNYVELSEILEENQNYCRKLISRAREKVIFDHKQHPSLPSVEQITLLHTFQEAVHSGNLQQLIKLLTQDVQLFADGGGKVSAISKPLSSIQQVTKFFELLLFKAWHDYQWDLQHINGSWGFNFYDDAKNCVMIAMFEFSQDFKIQNIYIQRNPEKINVATNITRNV